jgi:hypothetical protein
MAFRRQKIAQLMQSCGRRFVNPGSEGGCPPCYPRVRGASIMVEIKEVAVEIFHGKLTQSPRLSFKRFHDIRTRRL